ncbi:Carbamoyl dehydratase HypE [bioreactor metagenome]|uniref:Carbamoyl dehydratase HypE n=1 Tax=bioreactor metagenome TaxID=1076179 RepID=A0A645GBW8_9ZZZZ
MGILINETAVPVRPAVKAACDILGYDPLYMANEGKLIAIADARHTEKVLEIMRADCYGKDACVIGRVVSKPAGQVGLETAIGGIRLLDMLIGDQLPRIC